LLLVKFSALVLHFRGLDVASARLPLASAIFDFRSSSLRLQLPARVITLLSIFYISRILPVLLITCHPYPCILEVDTCL